MTMGSESIRKRRATRKLTRALAVLGALSLLVVLAVTVPRGTVCRVHVERLPDDLALLRGALDAYVAERGCAPDALEQLLASDSKGATFLRGRTRLPLDPWYSPYQYEPPFEGRAYRLYSLGKDGQPGGDGDDADRELEPPKGAER